ncbi:endonuclease domain-containing protein [Salinarimonas soli]|uniref:Endonuclease domain-containing protein n=1 Tax=Salinarimonas soli TaxID=1638099 RepID=A0A5B2VAG0_9HYPH|nr:DUF559 domain-containing protein [Salinarimonas soli]KAA2236513.1 endonuclease domain-containing protein [Salinarimonas soli]
MTTRQRRFARSLRQTATSAEDVLWQALRGRRLAGLKFRRQVPLLTYTLDFACIERRLVVELDGRQHEWFAEYDETRTKEIEREGFTVIRFANQQVTEDLDAVLAAICAAAAQCEPPRLATLTPGPSPIRERGESRT